MRILFVHNKYRHPGGEDVVVQSEMEMLRANGHDAQLASFDNDKQPTGFGSDTIDLLTGVAWSRKSYQKIAAICREFRPDVAHVHNFWMNVSPSVHAACHSIGVPTVQTLHNFRLLCTNGQFLRDGNICEDCLGKTPWRGVVRRCYRQSVPASSAVAAMIVYNRLRNTWTNDVDAFITLTEHSRSKFVAGGLPAGKVFVKPNFRTPTVGAFLPPSNFRTVLYVGRLSPEKGVDVLLDAWANGGFSEHSRLVIAGDGPDREQLENQAAGLQLRAPSVTFVGQQSPADIGRWLAQARCLVMPSRWYETFGMVVLEASSFGRPSIVSDVGALSELVVHNKTGLRVPRADAVALEDTLNTILTDAAYADRLGTNALANYIERYTPQRNYEMLMQIYRFAMRRERAALTDSLQSLHPSPMVHSGQPNTNGTK